MSSTATSLSKPKEAPFIPFHRAHIEAPEINAVAEVLKSGWLTTGPRVKQFEANFREIVGAQHTVAVGSCTAALHLSLLAVGVQPGDEVILPTMTFASCGETILYLGAKPVLVDCAPNSFHMDVEGVERAITPRTKAIMPVHYSGYARDLDSLKSLSSAKGVALIEDAAHAFPSRYNGKMIGAAGDITCFSFYATKTITTGEGGMIATANPEYADRIRMLSLHGISKDAWKRYSAEGTWRYEIEATGYKYNLTDLQAAIGIEQLKKCEMMRSMRATLAARYTKELSSLDAFGTPIVPGNVEHAWHLYVLEVNCDALTIDRDEMIQSLKRRGVGTSVHFIPLHLHRLYREQCGYSLGQFPNAEKRFSAALSLPLFPDLSFHEQDRIIDALHELAGKHRR
jgi:dTDP-4-amino-4,6-dideoxygalactose transaminase